MSLPRQALIGVVVAVIFAAAGVQFYLWRAGETQSGAATAGSRLMAAKLMGIDDKVQPFEQWRGKVLVVNFWATWCTPCREEIPGFVKFQDEHRADGVQFVGVAIDQKERVEPYAREMGINYPLLVGGLETMEFARQLGNSSGVLPFTLIIDRAGAVQSTKIGVLRPDKLESLIRPLL